VVVVNPTYHCDFGKKKQMALQLPEMLLLILVNELACLVDEGQVLLEHTFNRQRPKRGGNPFNIRTTEIVLCSTYPNFVNNACSNNFCKLL
jgi:hypothetical protein